MKKSSVLSVLYAVFACLFSVGIAMAMIGRVFCIRDTQNYQELQPELFAPDEIATVLRDPEQKQIYVCYSHASYVDVYTESGKFLWAVSVPYLQNGVVDFALQEDRLIVYWYNEAYIYSSVDGSFIEYANAEDLTLEYDSEKQPADKVEEGEFYFDAFQVYRGQADGSLEAIVSRPWWYRCFHFGLDMSIAFLGAVGIGVTIFLRKKKEYDLVRGGVAFGERKTRVIYNYFRVASAVHTLYAILDIIFGFFGGILCIGIVPLAIHFIISNIIFSNMLRSMNASIFSSRKEIAVLEYWKTVEIGTFVAAFLSVIVAVSIAA